MWKGGAGWVFGLRPVGLFALGAAQWRVGCSEPGWALFWVSGRCVKGPVSVVGLLHGYVF